jgi:proprotein convertase subtilisin/kexin type 2
VNDDDHRDGFAKWPFMTTHTWGEYPQGTWSLEVSTGQFSATGTQYKVFTGKRVG